MNQFAVQFGRLVVSYSFISIATLLIERLPKGKERIERYARDIQIIVIYLQKNETLKRSKKERERAIKIL